MPGAGDARAGPGRAPGCEEEPRGHRGGGGEREMSPQAPGAGFVYLSPAIALWWHRHEMPTRRDAREAAAPGHREWRTLAVAREGAREVERMPRAAASPAGAPTRENISDLLEID